MTKIAELNPGEIDVQSPSLKKQNQIKEEEKHNAIFKN